MAAAVTTLPCLDHNCRDHLCTYVRSYVCAYVRVAVPEPYYQKVKFYSTKSVPPILAGQKLVEIAPGRLVT